MMDLFETIGLVCLGVFVVGILFALFEMWQRSKYPIRADVTYWQGDTNDPYNRKRVITSDRIGYVEIKDKKGGGAGVKEWRLRRLNKVVLNFDYSFVGEKTIWYGVKKAQYAVIEGNMGDKGEEFHGVKFNSFAKDYQPIIDGDRGQLFWKVMNDIIQRNTYTNWLKANIIPLVQTGLQLLMIIMLFLCFMKLDEIVQHADGIIGAGQSCGQLRDMMVNKTATIETGGGTPTPGNVGGIPFGVVQK